MPLLRKSTCHLESSWPLLPYKSSTKLLQRDLLQRPLHIPAHCWAIFCWNSLILALILPSVSLTVGVCQTWDASPWQTQPYQPWYTVCTPVHLLFFCLFSKWLRDAIAGCDLNSWMTSLRSIVMCHNQAAHNDLTSIAEIISVIQAWPLYARTLLLGHGLCSPLP